MTALSSYATGTVSVGAGGTIVTAIGAIWSDGSAKSGDILQIGNYQSVIADVTDSTHLVIPPWGGGAQAGASYKIWQVSPQRFAGAEALATVNKLVAALSSNRIPVVVGDDETVPDPSLGEEDQTAIQPATGKVWVMTGGVWIYHGVYKGFNLTGPYNGATVYSAGDLMTDAGSSYVWINATPGSGHAAPNTTYWQLIASKGDTGATGATGATGPAGNMDGSNNLIELTNKQTARGNLSILSPPQGRLSLISGSPRMLTTQAGKTQLYYTLAVGNQVPIYDGTHFVMVEFTELLATTTDTTKSPAAIGASKVNDWFVWVDAGTVRLSHGPDWTSDTARSAGAAIAKANGVWINDVAITNGPPQYRGTYVGTTRSNASSQLDWILGGAGSGGVAGFLGVWNCYNRLSVTAKSTDSGASYPYTSSTVRQARASAGNQISMVIGLVDDAVSVAYNGRLGLVATGAAAVFGIGVNASNAFAGQGVTASGPSNLGVGGAAIHSADPQLGLNVFYACEQSEGTNANNFNVASQNAFSILARM